MRKFSAQTPDNCKNVVIELINEINGLPTMSLSDFAPEKTAMIVVDVVNGFIREGAMASPLVEDIIPEVAKLMDKCNKAEIPVVAFADCHKEDCSEFASFPPHCIENTSESELVDELKKVGGYFLMKKNSTNGFHEKIFKQCLIQNPTTNTFIVVGDCTDICVMQFCLTLKTWYTQQNRNIDIYIPVNAVETYDAPCHDADFMNIAAYKLMKDSGIRFVKEIK